MKRGEVWLVNLDPTIGTEIKKTLPCVIVNQDALAKLPLKIIIPLTSWDERYTNAPWHVKVISTRQNGLKNESSADTFQVRSISEKRFVKKSGLLDPLVLEEINQALSISLALD
jgi:mRNA interferase MazF